MATLERMRIASAVLIGACALAIPHSGGATPRNAAPSENMILAQVGGVPARPAAPRNLGPGGAAAPGGVGSAPLGAAGSSPLGAAGPPPVGATGPPPGTASGPAPGTAGGPGVAGDVPRIAPPPRLGGSMGDTTAGTAGELGRPGRIEPGAGELGD